MDEFGPKSKEEQQAMDEFNNTQKPNDSEPHENQKLYFEKKYGYEQNELEKISLFMCIEKNIDKETKKVNIDTVIDDYSKLCRINQNPNEKIIDTGTIDDEAEKHSKMLSLGNEEAEKIMLKLYNYDFDAKRNYDFFVGEDIIKLYNKFDKNIKNFSHFIKSFPKSLRVLDKATYELFMQETDNDIEEYYRNIREKKNQTQITK